MKDLMKKLLPLCLLSTAALTFSSHALGQDQTTDLGFPSAEGIAYSVGETNFTFEQLMQITALLVPNPETIDIAQAYPILANLAVEQELAADQARALGLDQDPNFQRTLNLIAASLLSDTYIARETEARLTDERIAAAYETYVTNFVPQNAATASHILLETEAEAVAAIERLNDGEDFASLAQELSIGPSGPSGGALGTFGQGQMVPPFEQAVFSMTPGTFSTAPVQTQFGFHVILLEALIPSEPEPLFAIQPQLVANLTQELQAEIRNGLRADADYNIVPFEDLDR